MKGAKVLLLIAALLFATTGCALLGQDRMEIETERALWEMTNEALEKSDAVRVDVLVEMRDYALAQALEGNRQAAIDDTHVATDDAGNIPVAEAERIQQWLITRNREETDRIWKMYEAALNPKSLRDLREVIAKIEAMRMARLSAEELKIKAFEFIRDKFKGVTEKEE